MQGPFWLGDDPEGPFPPPHLALKSPNGLLAAGGDLTPQRLLSAYRQGIFPWYSEGEPILWWSPNPRAALFPDELHISRSLKKRIRRHPYEVTLNRNFSAVVEGCAAPRGNPEQAGTWITAEMKRGYIDLHRLGHAHSVECWSGSTLVGGLYGVSVAGLFCAESMFSRANDASKIALVSLLTGSMVGKIQLMDIQMLSPHLKRLGAREIPRADYLRYLQPPPATG